MVYTTVYHKNVRMFIVRTDETSPIITRAGHLKGYELSHHSPSYQRKEGLSWQKVKLPGSCERLTKPIKQLSGLSPGWHAARPSTTSSTRKKSALPSVTRN